MATFVIVHGAWSGSYAWRWVRPLLRAAGHDVVTPSLTGLGERAHLATPRTGPGHVADLGPSRLGKDQRAHAAVLIASTLEADGALGSVHAQ